MLHRLVHWSFVISIHALREESDYRLPEGWTGKLKFQSTLSVRRATIQPVDTTII